MNVNIKYSIEELHKAFYLLNKSQFDNKLPEPAILIQNKGNKKNIFGWCSPKKIWKNSRTQETKYEINIVAEGLNERLYFIMATLLHEMIHLYDLINNIKDSSRNGTYHNKNFKKAAEAHGLNVEADKKVGWGIYSLNDETKLLIDSFKINDEAFSLFRLDKKMLEGMDEDGEERQKTSSRRLVCPGCGIIVRCTKKDANLNCGTCNKKLVWKEIEK